MSHDHKWERNWRRFEAMARRGFREFGGLGRDWGGIGENFRIGRMLASGDLRLVALFLIEQQPRHGYDLIKAVEERSHGFYSPSPGIVYPALTFLEEAGYVTSEAEGNKKLYTITEAGREHLNDNREAIDGTLDFLGKAGERMRHLREAVQKGEWNLGHDEGPETVVDVEVETGGGADGMRRPGWPFSHEERRRFRSMRHPGWPLHGETAAPPPRPDRDMKNVVPELNEARRTLKAALAEAAAQGEDAQRRAADILRRAAEDLRRPEPQDEIDAIDL